MRLVDGPLLLVGGGRMGGALLEGWLAGGLESEATWVLDPEPATRLTGLHHAATPAELPESAVAALVVAVKPQVVDQVLAPLARQVGPATTVVSIAAGKPISTFEAAFGPDIAVVRAMPNTPAAVGRGVSVLCANRAATEEARALAGRLMQAVGAVHWTADEDLMHAVTAVSGSGPAYVFHLIEALAAAGEAAGLPADLAMALAHGTVTGAGELAHRSSDTAETLRRNVTSPHGTTAAALAVLMGEGGLTPLLTRAVAAAAARSRELA